MSYIKMSLFLPIIRNMIVINDFAQSTFQISSFYWPCDLIATAGNIINCLNLLWALTGLTCMASSLFGRLVLRSFRCSPIRAQDTRESDTNTAIRVLFWRNTEPLFKTKKWNENRESAPNNLTDTTIIALFWINELCINISANRNQGFCNR